MERGSLTDNSSTQRSAAQTLTYVLQRNLGKATVEYSRFRDDTGKGNKTEHQDKNDKIQQDQKAQEGEVRLDACAKFPWEQKKQAKNYNNKSLKKQNEQIIPSGTLN